MTAQHRLAQIRADDFWRGSRGAAYRLVSLRGHDADEVLETLPAVDATPQHVTDEEVLGALERLPAAYQEVVLLADVEELTYKEIATMLQAPLGAVMSRLHRARRLLRRALAACAGVHGAGRPHDRMTNQGRRFAHVVVRRGTHVVSVLVTDMAPRPRRASRSSVAACGPADGFQVACSSAGGYGVFVVSDMQSG